MQGRAMPGSKPKLSWLQLGYAGFYSMLLLVCLSAIGQSAECRRDKENHSIMTPGCFEWAVFGADSRESCCEKRRLMAIRVFPHTHQCRGINGRHQQILASQEWLCYVDLIRLHSCTKHVLYEPITQNHDATSPKCVISK